MLMLHSPRQLNPAETAAFKAKMGMLPPEHQSDVALKWRERFVNVATAYAPTPLMATSQVAVSGAYSGLIGYWDGYNQYKRRQLVANWEQTAPGLGVNLAEHPTPFKDVVNNGQVVHRAVQDPTTLGPTPINRTLAATLALAGVSGIVALADRDGRFNATVNPFLKLSAMTGIGYAVGSAFRDAALKKEERKALAATTTGNEQPQNGGQDAAGNPWMRYRAA